MVLDYVVHMDSILFRSYGLEYDMLLPANEIREIIEDILNKVHSPEQLVDEMFFIGWDGSGILGGSANYAKRTKGNKMSLDMAMAEHCEEISRG